ncbi:GNAT family N-acetyltransferase [Paenibacillus glycanilyticus]|uniref:GNAT family N-acetyltransferase n=1 Tax=Paenibacillus glycanilyticus TaxID=126569 RepID=UPI00204260DE|nr:GNAT family protein [Paenibacillus glycanilyticus]MCM3629161.1 GNAT family N-acetyltransferase [Paenibacillus glycanilyticus]
MSQSGLNPMLMTIPESFESARLIIRAPLHGDGAAINEAVIESLEELRPWMPWAKGAPTMEESEISIRKSRLEFLGRTDFRLLLFHKETGQLVGSSGLHRMDWHARSFEIGYWARTSYAGQGYITEAVEAIASFAIQVLEANRIEIHCDARNKKSANVAERTGFTLEGVLRNHKNANDGSLRDTMVFSKVRGVEF